MRDVNTTRPTFNDTEHKQTAGKDKGILNDLILSLPVEERARYSKLFIDSLLLNAGHQFPDVIESTGGMLQRAENDFLSVNFWQKLKIRLFALFHDVSHRSSYIERKLMSTAHSANKHKRLFNVRTASLTSGFLFPFAQLYNTLIPLLHIYENNWDDVNSVRSILCEYLKQVLPSTVYKLETYLSADKMKELSKKGVNKHSMFDYLQGQVSSYFQKLSPTLLQEIETDLFSLYVYRFVCQFNFKKMFSLFGVRKGQSLFFSRRPSVSFLDCRGLLFQFFYSLSELYRLPKNFDVSETLFHVLARYSPDKLSSEGIKKVMVDARVFAEQIFSEKVIVATLQCAYHDPYYKPSFIHNVWNIRDFVYADIVLRVWYQYSGVSWRLHPKSSKNSIDQLFPMGLPGFNFMTGDSCPTAADLELPKLLYTTEIQIIRGFITEIFMVKIVPWISSIHMNSNVNMKLYMNSFVRIKNNCEAVKETIDQLDEMFSISEPIGKKFSTICLDINNTQRLEQAKMNYSEHIRSINTNMHTILMRGKRVIREVSDFLGNFDRSISGNAVDMRGGENAGGEIIHKVSGIESSVIHEILTRCDDYASVVHDVQELIGQITEDNQLTNMQGKHNGTKGKEQKIGLQVDRL